MSGTDAALVEAPALDPWLVPDQVTDLVRCLTEQQVIASRASSAEWQKINALEQQLAGQPQVEMPLDHTLPADGLGGWYLRSICIPRGTLATTRIHLFEHPFVISAGRVSVWNEAERRWQRFQASHHGVTKAGTRRVLYAHTDVIWHTFHVTDETDPNKIADLITMNPMNLGHLDHLSDEQKAVIEATAKPPALK